MQVAIDARDRDTAEKYVNLAIEAGADWIEVGTPLIVYQGISVIQFVVELAGGRPVVADFKAQDGVAKYFLEAAAQGASVATVLGAMPNGSIKAAVQAKEECGIRVMVDLLGVNEPAKRAAVAEDLGADYILLHTGFDEARDGAPDFMRYLEQVLASVHIPVGLATFTAAEAERAIGSGASWVVQGEPLLSSVAAREQLSAFVAAVKSGRR